MDSRKQRERVFVVSYPCRPLRFGFHLYLPSVQPSVVPYLDSSFFGSYSFFNSKQWIVFADPGHKRSCESAIQRESFLGQGEKTAPTCRGTPHALEPRQLSLLQSPFQNWEVFNPVYVGLYDGVYLPHVMMTFQRVPIFSRFVLKFCKTPKVTWWVEDLLIYGSGMPCTIPRLVSRLPETAVKSVEHPETQYWFLIMRICQ